MRIQHGYNQNHHQQYTLVFYSLYELQLIGLMDISGATMAADKLWFTTKE